MPAYPRYQVDAELLDRARELQARSGSVRPGELDEIVDRIERTAARSGMTTQDYLMHRADTVDVSSPPGGALFWSRPCPDDPGLRNRYLAEAWAERHNATHPESPVTTIEMTPGGAEFDSLRLHDLSGDHLDRLRVAEDLPDKVWRVLSDRYAHQASGEALVFADENHPATVLSQQELHTMQADPEIGAERISFVYPPPERVGGRDVPENVRDEMTAPGNQARFQFHQPGLGYLDLERLGTMDRAAVHAELATKGDIIDGWSATRGAMDPALKRPELAAGPQPLGELPAGPPRPPAEDLARLEPGQPGAGEPDDSGGVGREVMDRGGVEGT